MAEQVGGGLSEIAARFGRSSRRRPQLSDVPRRRFRSEREQRFAGLDMLARIEAATRGARRVVRGEQARRERLRAVALGIRRSAAPASLRPSTALDLRRAAGRRAAAAPAPRSSRRWSIPRRLEWARRRRSGRSCRRGHFEHGRLWSARRGRTRWPTARPPAFRTRAMGCRARERVRGMRIAMSVEPGGGEFRHRATGDVLGRTRVSGPGQNASASASAVASNRPIGAGSSEIADMGDQRAGKRAFLGLIEAGDGECVGRICPEAIDRLGRKRDQPAVGERSAGGCGHGGLGLRAKSRWSGRFPRGFHPLRRASCGAGKATL